jgi:hypothetical protein
MQSTAVRPQENQVISTAYRRRTFSGQSGGLENVGPRETKFGLMSNPTVRSFSQESPQLLGISAARLSGREICRRAKWRRRRCWQLTLSTRKLLILLDSHSDVVRIPRADPRNFWKCCFSSSLGSPDRLWPGSSGGFHFTVRAGGCATQTGLAASAGAEAAHALTVKPDHCTRYADLPCGEA